MKMSIGQEAILKGTHKILNHNRIRNDIDPAEIERDLINKGVINESNVDPSDKFKQELKNLASQLNITFEATPKTPLSARAATPRPPTEPEEAEEEPEEEELAQSPPMSIRGPGSARSSPGHTPFRPSWTTPRTEFEKKTEEEMKYSQIQNVMKEMGHSSAHQSIISLEEARREDQKMNMLEEIDTLWTMLEEECVKGLDKIPRPNQDSSYELVENVLKRLRLKNDSARYSTTANEIILWAIDELEEIFNGKQTFFGRYRPNLVGFSKHAQVKLRSMRPETFAIMSNFMQDYNIHPVARILLEIVPSMVVYSHNKNRHTPTRNYDSEGISNHMDRLRNME
jgi:hypothetical protein